jgi:hypothetical protein
MGHIHDMNATQHSQSSAALRRAIAQADAGKTPGETGKDILESHTLARTGTCRLTLNIGETRYSIRISRQWGLNPTEITLKNHRKQVYRISQTTDGQTSCTCPDHAIRGARCKHLGALTALGLLARPKAPRPARAPRVSNATATTPAQEPVRA